ncbi:MAG: L,D-transpeptidase family protein [Prevotella sp.]
MKSAAFFVALLMLIALQSCGEKTANPNASLSLSDYETLDTTAFRLHARKIKTELERLALTDEDTTLADSWTRSYYLDDGDAVWIDRIGVDNRPDSLLQWLDRVGEMGFSKRKFCVSAIEQDLRRLRALDFDDSANTIDCVMARLEYHLTKGYLRYVTGQRFGFVNPGLLFNRLDRKEGSDDPNDFQRLFDLPIERARHRFRQVALGMARSDSLSWFIREVQPQSRYYYDLQKELAKDNDRRWDTRRLLVNMERFRWRLSDVPSQHEKYVLVNIPSFQLMAVDGDSVLLMRIGCGTLKTKTPLLQSRLKRMDVNPQWIVPRSIVKKSILPHVGSSTYFHSRHFFVRDRKTGQVVPPATVTPSMLLDGDYLVIQEGGKYNSLGRIIFRFDNKFSVYLHDTSSPEVFTREDRGVSHGCIRVERPFDLGVFLLEDKDPTLIEKMRYSMSADVSPVGKKESEMSEEELAVNDTLDRKKLVGNIPLKLRIPIYIYYYTLMPSKDGKWYGYDDVYGYDEVIYNYLRNFI